MSDVAMATRMTSAQAKKVLDQCHLDQLANMHVSESGAVVYTVYEAGEADG